MQDSDGTIYVLPDGPHLHPRVLGESKPALFAGDVTIEEGVVLDITNLSGTFQFDEPEGLLFVVKSLGSMGFELHQQAIRYFPMDGSRPPVLYLE